MSFRIKDFDYGLSTNSFTELGEYDTIGKTVVDSSSRNEMTNQKMDKSKKSKTKEDKDEKKKNKKGGFFGWGKSSDAPGDVKKLESESGVSVASSISEFVIVDKASDEKDSHSVQPTPNPNNNPNMKEKEKDIPSNDPPTSGKTIVTTKTHKDNKEGDEEYVKFLESEIQFLKSEVLHKNDTIIFLLSKMADNNIDTASLMSNMSESGEPCSSTSGPVASEITCGYNDRQ